jgi:glycosyltransferase involved in cell wall biosynthesis
VREWYRTEYGKCPIYVPYGAKVSPRDADTNVLRRLGVENDRYILFVGALVPEKGVHHLIRAFNALNAESGFDLAIVGGNPYGSAYELSLRELAGDHVKFLGSVYGSDAENLFKGAYFYATASELEGTSPALLSAMGFGNCVLVSDIPENLETIGDAGMTFRNMNVSDLSSKMLQLILHPNLVEDYRKRAVERVARYYSWESVAQRIEEVYSTILGGK